MVEKEKLGKGIEVILLKNEGDERGFSYNVPKSALKFIGKIKDAHIATIVPGAIRGNHYHVGRKEFILVWFNDSWIFAWDQDGGAKKETKTFFGTGLILIEIDMDISHAIKNTGDKDIFIMAFSNKEYDVENSDTHRRIVIR